MVLALETGKCTQKKEIDEHKFDLILTSNRSLQVCAAIPIKKLTWLMFILGKIKILQGAEDIAEMAYLLYACLYWAIMLSPKDVQCDLIDSK